MAPLDRDITRFEELINYIASCFQSLLVGNGAGLLACLTAVKDYATTPAYRGLGTLVLLFVIGLIGALLGIVAMLAERMALLTHVIIGERTRSKWISWIAGFAGIVSISSFITALTLIAASALRL